MRDRIFRIPHMASEPPGPEESCICSLIRGLFPENRTVPSSRRMNPVLHAAEMSKERYGIL
jgi:hypothetical protein